MISANKLGSVYRCPICGAEVSVMRHGEGHLGPYCCNEPMELTDRINLVYRCSMCGTEVMAIKEADEGRLEPYCCDTLMMKINKSRKSKNIEENPEV
jgi:desulfoferrodoxin-like iron-binding protein